MRPKLFSGDVERVTGFEPKTRKGGPKDLSTFPVIIGTIGQSELIGQLIEKKSITVDDIKGEWESYRIAVVVKPFKNVEQALVIAHPTD